MTSPLFVVDFMSGAVSEKAGSVVLKLISPIADCKGVEISTLRVLTSADAGGTDY